MKDRLLVRRGAGIEEPLGIRGFLTVRLWGPDMELLFEEQFKNLVTSVGDQYYAGRAALTSSLPAAATGMRLGSGTTAPAKSSTGSAIITYLTGSNHAFDSGYPQASAGKATYRCTYVPGEATTGAAITEAVINTDTIANNNATTATSANTLSRALISGVAAKGALDTLELTWEHVLLGA